MKVPKFLRRQPADSGAVNEALRLSQLEAERARQARESIDRRKPAIDSLVSYLEERRRKNGFGEDFTIGMTPRTRKHLG